MLPARTMETTRLGWLLIVVALVALAGQADHQLWTPDEPREAAIALEMTKSGDWVVPTLGGASFIEKPPLYYIAAAPFLALAQDWLGVTDTLRLINAAWALGTLLFTGLLARHILGSREAALWSVIALGTMEGFVTNTHWIRVDVALAFFVVFSMWAFAAFYRAGQWLLAIIAALALGGSFMAKGLIGPGTVFFGWLALFVFGLRDARHNGAQGRFWLQHLLMAVCFMLPVGMWILALLRHDNADALWQQWFWENQVGRLTGTSTQLGHIKKHAYFYYLNALLEYSLPWLPLIVAWFWQTIAQRRWDRPRLFLLSWSVLTLALLTISSTKRTLYLFPLLPVFALMIGQLSGAWPRWLNAYARGWSVIAVLFCLALVASPLFAGWLPAGVPDEAREALGTLGWRHIAGAAVLAGGLWLLTQWRRMTGAALMTGAMAVLYLALFILAVPAIDAVKGMRADTEKLVAQVPPAQRARVAGWNLDETERGLFSIYGDWRIVNVDAERVQRIMRCQDPDFDSVMVNKDSTSFDLANVVGPQYRLLAEASPRKRAKYGMFWVEGECRPAQAPN